MLSGGRQLQISIAEKSDAASYVCMASNVAGKTKKDYKLLVYGRSSCKTACRSLLVWKPLLQEMQMNRTMLLLETVVLEN